MYMHIKDFSIYLQSEMGPITDLIKYRGYHSGVEEEHIQSTVCEMDEVMDNKMVRKHPQQNDEIYKS